MSDLVTVKQTRGAAEQVNVNQQTYQAVKPSMLLHKVTDEVVADVPGCEAQDAADLVKYSQGLYVRVGASKPPVKASKPSKPSKASKPKMVEVEIVTEPEAQEQLSPPPLELLDQSVAALANALVTGNHDKHLKALLAAEEAGKTRRGAVRVINERISEIGG